MDQIREDLSLIRAKLEQMEQCDHALATHVEVLRSHVTRLEQELRGDIKHLESLFLGNGHAGLRLRIDRLERGANRRRKQAALLWGAIIAAVLNAAVSWLVR
ncbi:MAG: hypothetical protein WD847_02670 [Pirellulales bacterium]